MKTIELMISGQVAQFTTRSVTLDGREYFYSNMTNLQHSPIILTYTFDYDGETQRFVYQKKDAKILSAIFSQVHKLEERKKAQAAAAEEQLKASAAPVEEPAVEAEPETPAEEAVAEEVPAATEETEAEAEESEEAKSEKTPDDTMEAMIQATIALNEERAKKQAEKEARKAKRKAIREAKKNGTPIPEEYLNDESEEKEAAAADPEKHEKIKKSLKIFGIIIAAVLVVSVIYYFAFGTSNAPTEKSPNNTESQQYDDIDQLIDDMQ